MIVDRGLLTPNELIGLIDGITTVQGIYKTIDKLNIETIHHSSRKKLIPPLGVRKLLKDKSGFAFDKKFLSMFMIKGGVGKTTLASTLALRSSHYGVKVLLIDFDLQANLTRSFNIEARDYPAWIDIITEHKSVKDCIISISDTLDIIPSNLNNSRLDIELSSNNFNLKDYVKDSLESVIDDYELVIFDCPPALNKVSVAAVCASDLVIIPITPDPYSMDGLEMTIKELQRIKRAYKLNMNYKLIWNMYDDRKRLAAIYLHDIAKKINIDLIIPIVIRVDSAFANAISECRSIFELPKKKCQNAKKDIDQFTREILELPWITEQDKEIKNHSIKDISIIAQKDTTTQPSLSTES